MSDLMEQIKSEYIDGLGTYRELAQRHGVSMKAVARAGRNGMWRELKRRKCAERLPSFSCPGECGIRESVLQLAGRMAALGADAMADDAQFSRYIVSDRAGGETVTGERVFDKLDTKAYKELSAAVKDLWSIAQDAGESTAAGVTVEFGEGAAWSE